MRTIDGALELLPRHHCPHCGAPISAAFDATPSVPQTAAGELGLCINCLGLLVLGSDRTVRAATELDLAAADAHQPGLRAEIAGLSALVRAEPWHDAHRREVRRSRN